MSAGIRDTHECDLTPKQNMVIKQLENWILLTHDDQGKCLKYSATIEYCPFCGEKLE